MGMENDLREAAMDIVRIFYAANSKKPLFSCQGQAMDGYTELANYRFLVEKFIDILGKDWCDEVYGKKE